MANKEKTIDHLLGALSIEEKTGQLLVLGLTGVFAGPEIEDLIDQRCISGLRTSPSFARKFIRYLPDGADGVENVNRPPIPGEKMWDDSITPPPTPPSHYAKLLNELRLRAMDRKHAIPLHFTIDIESGGGNYAAPGVITAPSQMGFGKLNDLDLIRRTNKVAAMQMKAIGFNMLQNPVADVNINPSSPEVSTRAFGEDPDTVTKCTRAALKGLAEGGVIACLKHYPGRGASDDDSHFGVCVTPVDKETMYRVFLEPYRALSAEGLIPAVMPAHAIYPTLDDTNEIATVSHRILTGILREEFGFQGLITTDSMTMGGLMARYSVGEAVVRAVNAGVDILLLKDDNALRYEAHDALIQAVKDSRLTEARIDESLRRIWSAKWDLGLFEDGGVVETDGLDEALFAPAYRDVAEEAARRCMEVLRDDLKVLPLKPEQQVLVVDRATPSQIYENNTWNHPGMFWNFMLRHSRNVSYIDYQPHTIDATLRMIDQVAPQMDVIVATSYFTRTATQDTKNFILKLKKYGKPVVLLTNNPYELAVPPEMETVVCSYGMMHDTLKAASDFLYGIK